MFFYHNKYIPLAPTSKPVFENSIPFIRLEANLSTPSTPYFFSAPSESTYYVFGLYRSFQKLVTLVTHTLRWMRHSPQSSFSEMELYRFQSTSKHVFENNINFITLDAIEIITLAQCCLSELKKLHLSLVGTHILKHK